MNMPGSLSLHACCAQLLLPTLWPNSWANAHVNEIFGGCCDLGGHCFILCVTRRNYPLCKLPHVFVGSQKA